MVGAEGGVWFVAKGSGEASITLTFERVLPEAAALEDVIASEAGN